MFNSGSSESRTDDESAFKIEAEYSRGLRCDVMFKAKDPTKCLAEPILLVSVHTLVKLCHEVLDPNCHGESERVQV